MGSLARKIRRNRQRIAYDNFTRAFMGERRYQEHLIEEEKMRQFQAWSDGGEEGPITYRIDLKELLEGNPRLGKKPSFSIWRESVAVALEQQKREFTERNMKQLEKDLKDLDWKDDG